MRTTPSINHRAQKNIRKKLQEGTILSFTTVRHPPEGFGDAPRMIGLIELGDGSKVLSHLLPDHPSQLGRAETDRQPTTDNRQPITIGMHVLPRLRLSRIHTNGLRTYDVAYEVVSNVPVATEFPGYIFALTGPSGVGKTTVSILLSTKVGDYVERVPIITTRSPKAGDEQEYVHVSAEEFLELKNGNALSACTSIPSSTEKRWYGYRTEDIERIWRAGKIPIVITEMDLLQGLASHFGRRSILSCGLLPPGKSKRQMLSALLHRLRTRGRDTESQIRDRLRNAEADLQFFKDRSELFDHLIINDKVEAVVETLSGRVLEYAKA